MKRLKFTLPYPTQLLILLMLSTQAYGAEHIMITIADAHSSPAVYVDAGISGDSVGDQYIFDQPLLDNTGKTIGVNSGFCLRTRLQHSLQC